MQAAAAGAASARTIVPQPRLVRAAHEFEAQMMKELLKQTTDSGALFGEDEEASSSQALGEFAAEALGRGLSEHGGLGLANRIVAQLSRSGNPAPGGKVTANPHGNTVMGNPE